MGREEKTYRHLGDKLHGLRQREKVLALWKGCFICVAALVGAGFVLVLMEAIFRWSSAIRILLVMGFTASGVCVLCWWVGRPLFSLLFRRHFPDDDSLALRVGDGFPKIKDRLTDGIQVFRAHRGGEYGVSSSLAVTSLMVIYDEVKSLDFRRVASNGSFFRSMRIAVLVVAVSFLGVGLFPGSLGSALGRISHPWRSFSAPAPFRLVLRPGNVRVVHGEDVEISVEGEGDVPQEVSLFLREEEGEFREKILRKPFLYPIVSIRSSVDYFARGGEIQTPTCRISVVQRPMVRTLRLKLIPPPYARLGVLVSEPNAGDVKALKGTKVEVSVTANKPLSRATLVFEKAGKRQMAVRGREAGGEFFVGEADRYWIELMDTLGFTNSNSIPYTIRVQPDLNPVARILFPGEHVDLDEEMKLDLTLKGEDDFGLSRCRLSYCIQREGSTDSSATEPSFVPLHMDEGEPARVLLNTTWDMETLELFPEDVVSYAFEVFDNDRVSGPKRGRSRTFTVRFPSIYEIFQEVDREQSGQVETLMEIYRESEGLREELEKISDDLKGGKEPEWEDRKNVERITEKQQSMKEEVDGLREKLEDLVDRMERNDLLSLETLEKYQELQELYEEISSPELLEAMKKLQEAVKRVSEEELRRAMDRFRLTQEGFLKSIERTISLLKRLQVEQKTGELVRRIEDLVERQEAVNQDLAREAEKELSELARNEKEIAQDTQELRQEMEKLNQRMGELPGMPLSKMEAALDTMESQDLLGQLERLEQMIQSGEMRQASDAGAGAHQTMTSLAEMLKEMEKSLQRDQKGRVARALRKASYRLLELSKKQEELGGDVSEGKVSGQRAAEEQMSLLSGLAQVADSLYTLSRETFFVTPEMGRALGEAQNQMRRALGAMEQPGGKGTSEHQGEAMGALNRAVLAIQSAMGRLAGMMSGLGMEEYFLQLEKMAQQQMSVNQLTAELLRRGRLTLEEQAAMSRLAAEQEAVRKVLEELLREFGNRSEIAGRLDRMVQEMDEVVRELKQQQASSETIRRQERILSRLLDAQHSIRRRDYSRRRQAREGRDVIRRSPEPTQMPGAEWMDRIQRDILRMVEEGYTQDYQELIRKYFEAFVREEIQ